MEKGSAPPMEHDHHQQAIPDAPPTYEQSQGAGGFHAPPPGVMYPPLPQENKGVPPTQPTPTVVTQVQYVAAPNFGYRPVNMVCPHCQQNITTATDSEPSAMAWVLSAVFCVLQLYCCVCVPCCIDSLQTVTHKCPNCKKFLGRYKGNF